MAASSDRTVLSSGKTMPLVGLGCWKIEGFKAQETVTTAIKLGYRHFDCAADYGNEREIGEAFSQAFASGVVRREDLFITSKLWNTDHAREHVKAACMRSMYDLRVDYLDLYLVHFPIAMRHVPHHEKYPAGAQMDKDGNPIMAKVPIRETWEAMEALVDEGLVHSIGVANFNCALISDLMTYARIPPAVNQIEMHPYLVQPIIRGLCLRHQIHLTAYSPLGFPSYKPLGVPLDGPNFLDLPIMKEISSKHGKSAAQVALRWNIQKGASVVPKSVTPSRLEENLAVFDFSLTDDEVSQLDALDRRLHFNNVGLPSVWNCPIYE